MGMTINIMTIDITMQVQAAYLIGIRRWELQRTDTTFKDWYIIREDDPIPKGLSVGDIINVEFSPENELLEFTFGRLTKDDGELSGFLPSL